MAELTGKARSKLADSDFAVVRKTAEGKKERKFPVQDEAHQRSALQMSHGARSGTPASPDEHRAVHAAVGRRNKALLGDHMREAHGAGKLKRALDGLVAQISPPGFLKGRGRNRGRGRQPFDRRLPPAERVQPAPRLPLPLPLPSPIDEINRRRIERIGRTGGGPHLLPRMRSGGVAEAPSGMAQGQWTVVNSVTKTSLGTFKDRHGAVGAVLGAMKTDPKVLADLKIMQVFNAGELVQEVMADHTWGR